ncbi:MAG TPA: DoxX family membrane protein [Solirubrobacteraceae bacterium]|nr:DoxX family membrane protein [Solirubrobacteraceae bacterium]
MTRSARSRAAVCARRAKAVFEAVETQAQTLAIRHGIAVLRLSMGVIFLGFGILKFFPHVSPAQDLATATLSRLTLGLVGPSVGIVLIATLESFIGACLIAGRLMRLTVWLLTIELVGILSPLVLLPGRLFTGPHHAPNIVGQYVLKDLILAAVVVVLMATLKGRLAPRCDEVTHKAVPAPDSHTFDLSAAVTSSPA